MKIRQKAGILAVFLAAAAVFPAGASEKEDDYETILTAAVPASYTLTIPQTTNIVYMSESTNLKGELTVSGNVDTNQKVTVTAEANPLHNASHNADLPYTLKLGNDVFTTAEWSEDELRNGLEGSGKEGKKLQLSVAITTEDWEAAKAGAYEGNIIFKAVLQSETQKE